MKDRQPFVIFFIILTVILLIGFVCYTYLEIVPHTDRVAPSREVKENKYLALERWLLELGYSMRSSAVGSVDAICNASEKTVFLENSRFNWTNKEQLVPWIREGGRLIISIDTTGEELQRFMEMFGVKDLDYLNSYNDDKDNLEENVESDSGKYKISKVPTNKKEDENNFPLFGWKSEFTVTANPDTDGHILVMGNKYGEIKLVKVELDKGWVVFTGEAIFLTNSKLQKKENSKLAGELFLNEMERENSEKSIFFIRKLDNKRHLLGKLAERGNPMALAVSIALLVVIGFWMVIPSFGRNKPEPQGIGKPLRERFLAEGTFLAKYHALGKYIEVYRRELEHSRGIKTTSAAGITVNLREFVREQKRLTKQLEEL